MNSGGLPVRDRHAIDVPFLAVDEPLVRATEPHRALDEARQHRLEVEGRAADDLEDLAGGRLPCERLGSAHALRAPSSVKTGGRSRSRSPPGRRRSATNSICLSENGPTSDRPSAIHLRSGLAVVQQRDRQKASGTHRLAARALELVGMPPEILEPRRGSARLGARTRPALPTALALRRPASGRLAGSHYRAPSGFTL